MKKYFSLLFILLLLGSFCPLAVVDASGSSSDLCGGQYTGCFKENNDGTQPTGIIENNTNGSVSFLVTINTGAKKGDTTSAYHVYRDYVSNNSVDERFVVVTYDTAAPSTKWMTDITDDAFKLWKIDGSDYATSFSVTVNPVDVYDYTKFIANHTYKAELYYRSDSSGEGGTGSINPTTYGVTTSDGAPQSDVSDYYQIAAINFTTPSQLLPPQGAGYYFISTDPTKNTNQVNGPYSESSCVDAQANAIIAKQTIMQHCFQSDTKPNAGVPINPDPNKGQSFNPVYTLLAPLGDLKTVDSTQPNALNVYVNIIFKFAIGLCALLAIVLIVVYGIALMGEESVFGRTEAKAKIGGAIGGLLLALAAWAILNTINPDFVGTSLNISQVNVVLDSAPILQDPDPSSVPVGSSAGICTSPYKIVQIPSKYAARGKQYIFACNMPAKNGKPVSDNIIAMLNAANGPGGLPANQQLTAAGFRTNAQQIALRKTNGCPDIYNSPASACTTPTAIPGTSNHESGLAFDLQCGGVQIELDQHPATKACHDWLDTNASKTYGLYPLDAEDWHWSIDGH